MKHFLRLSLGLSISAILLVVIYFVHTLALGEYFFCAIGVAAFVGSSYYLGGLILGLVSERWGD
jgi:hypothetical protein